MMIRQLLPGDDLKTAARLIYDTDSKGFARMFGPREKAVSSIEKLIQLDSNHFSHRFIWVWCDDAVRALMIVFTREEMRHSLKSTDYLACFSPVELAALAERLRPAATDGRVQVNPYLLRAHIDGHEFTVFPDGRAIIKGTADEAVAATLYAKYIGV